VEQRLRVPQRLLAALALGDVADDGEHEAPVLITREADRVE
jgi:hypothetical protein